MLNIGVMFRNNEHIVYPFFYFLRKSTVLPIKVIAVNQASTDTTETELKKHLRNNDELINLNENLGCAGGRNKILDASKGITDSPKSLMAGRAVSSFLYGDILFIDSDCFIIQKNSIENMLNVDADVVFGRTINFYTGEIDNRGFCFCLVRRRVFEKIGKFNDDFKLFYDDTDFIDRTVIAGFNRKTCRDALALHLSGETIIFGSEQRRYRDCLDRDRQLYERIRVF